jgi:hypothetical protein
MPLRIELFIFTPPKKKSRVLPKSHKDPSAVAQPEHSGLKIGCLK